MFYIGAKYYETIIKVTDLPTSHTQWPASWGTCLSLTVPTEYTDAGTGFSQNTTDVVIVIDIIDNSSESFRAQATACMYGYWPTFGGIRFNMGHMDTDLSKPGDFYGSVLTTIHEIGHIFGVSNWAFKNRMKVSYKGSGYRPQNETVAAHPTQANV